MLSPHVPDLDTLELLLDVAADGSLGAAGRRRGLGQPAVSARIRRAEALVGVRLVDRGPRGSRLTAEGALVADWAREVLTAASALDAGIASLRGGRDTRLRVAASLTVAEHLLPRWLVHLASNRPDTAVSLTAINSAQVADAVRDGRADLGFVEGPRVGTGLESRTVARDRLVLVVAPGHPWATRRRPVDAAELAATRLVHREPTSGTRAALVHALRGHGEPAAPLLELSTASGVRSAVLTGAGAAVLSSLAVHDDIFRGTLVAVPVVGVDLTRRLRAVWVKGSRRTGPAEELLAIAARRVDRNADLA